MILVAVCSAAGCTSVSAPPAHVPALRPSAPRPAGPEHPDDLAVVQPPGQEVLATARPHDPVTARPSSAAPPPAVRARVAPSRRRVHRAAPHRRKPRAPLPTAVRLPGGGNVCELSEAYGGWAADSQAARICRRASGR
jgi:hypothetical protein